MRKNDLVQFTQAVKEDIADKYRHDESDGVVDGFRSMTADEVTLWREQFNLACREGRAVPHDSAGESVLNPTCESVSFPLNGVFIVLKARTCLPWLRQDKGTDVHCVSFYGHCRVRQASPAGTSRRAVKINEITP